MIIVIDPGHGGKFNHASGQLPGKSEQHLEKDLVLKYAHLLRYLLGQRKHEVILTREYDKHLAETVSKDLQARVQLAHDYDADLFISLHCNGFEDPQAHGFEVWTSPGQTSSDLLADEIISEISMSFPEARPRTDLSDGDLDKESKFHVLVGTRCPAVLVELGFMTNVDDLARMTKHHNISETCHCIDRAVESWVDNHQDWLDNQE